MSSDRPGSPKLRGPARILVAVYAVLAIAATGRSVFQIIDRFDEAPIAFSLSAVAAVVYIVATLALAFRWDRIAWITIGFELLGVLVIGTLSLVDPQLFPHDTVWSVYGRGYVFIPLVLPILGMWWLARHAPERAGRNGAAA